jgi:hypothetical protein
MLLGQCLQLLEVVIFQLRALREMQREKSGFRLGLREPAFHARESIEN